MTKEERKLFGTKVRCYKYLKDQRFSIVRTEDLDDDGEATRNKRVLADEEFNGIIIGTLDVISSYVFGLTFDDYTNEEMVCVNEKKYTRCYKVAYQNNKTRYVPIDFCEVIEND